jgi:hypothetical protein
MGILRPRSMRRKRTTSFPGNSSRSHSCQSEQSAARRVRSFFFGRRVTGGLVVTESKLAQRIHKNR